MKKDYLAFGILIGFLLVFCIVSYIKIQNGPNCPVCVNVSEYKEEIKICQKKIDILKNTEDIFIKNIFAIPTNDREYYLSHFDECFIKEKQSDKDACVMSFIFETKEYSACFLLSEISLRTSCLNLREE
jgi:hydrogenase maturation factor